MHTESKYDTSQSASKGSLAGQTLYPIATWGKGSGQTPITVRSQLVQEFLGPVIGLEFLFIFYLVRIGEYVVVKAWFGVLYAQYSTRGEVEKPIQHEQPML